MVDVQDVETNPPSSGAEKKRKHDREKDEDQFILRLPDPLSNEMRLGLASKAKRDAAGREAKFSIHFVSDRQAFFHLNDKRYAATLYDLPALVETHKTADKRTYYKSADVHQVLVVRLPELPVADAPAVPPLPPPSASPPQPSPPQPFMLNDGISPASRGAAHRFHTPAPSLISDDLNDVERGIKYVIDNKLSFVRKQEAEEEPDEVKIEVDADPPAETTSGATNIPVEPSVAPAVAPPVVPSTPLSAAATPSPAPATPMDAATPTPAPTDGDAPMEDDLDDFAAMLGDEIMEDTNDDTKQRLEKTRLDSKIEDQKALIKTKQDEAANVPNPMLRKRMLGKIEPLEKALKELEEDRKKLG